MKIGCIQFAPILGDPAATMKKLEILLPQAQGADLLVLPELCNSGYNFKNTSQAWENAETIQDSQFISFLQGQCAKFHLHIVSGFNEKNGSALFNSAVLVGPKGFIGKYQKLHLFFNEKDFFNPGTTGLPVFQIGDYKVGIQICFDWMFPESWRVLTLESAEIICHPSNLVLPGLAQRAVPIHAMVNRVFTITANRIGSEGDLTFTGLSTIANPQGEVIQQATPDAEQILMIDIDIAQARNKQITPRNHVLKDRLPAEYHLLTEEQMRER